MLRRDRADELYAIAIRRYREEYPDRELDEKFLDSLWFSIYGKLIADGEEAAEEYVKNGCVIRTLQSGGIKICTILVQNVCISTKIF